MRIQLKALFIIISLPFMSMVVSSLYAWNETGFLFPYQHKSNAVAEKNNSSSSFCNDDEMPDMWHKRRGGFTGMLGEVLITLPLFNQMDWEAAVQKWSYIISWPLINKNKKPEAYSQSATTRKSSTQTDLSFGGTTSILPIRTDSDDDEQPPDQDAIDHTHGTCCHAQGCNGGRCRCKECSTKQIEIPPAKKRKIDRSRFDEKIHQSPVNIFHQLKQREVGAKPVPVDGLANLSQNRLAANSLSPVVKYTSLGFKPENDFFTPIGVLHDGRMVLTWGGGSLMVWSPQALIHQGYINVKRTYEQGDPLDLPQVSTHKAKKVGFCTNINQYSESYPLNKKHCVFLSGHSREISNIFIRRDGRIVTRSKDLSIRIWSEHNSNWSSNVIIESGARGFYQIEELDDGSMMFYTFSDGSTRIATEHGECWTIEKIDGSVCSLRDGCLYRWVEGGIRIWSINNNESELFLPYDYENGLCVERLDDKSIVTVASEGNLCVDNSYARLWSKKNDGTWVSEKIWNQYIIKITQINNTQLILIGTNLCRIISKSEDTWTLLNCILRNNHLLDPTVLKAGQILTSDDKSGCSIWSIHNDECHSEDLKDENGAFFFFSKVLPLKDGRWVSCSNWNKSNPGELRVWEYQEGSGRWSSSLIASKVFCDVYGIVELPGGWVAVTYQDVWSTTNYLSIWDVFPNRSDSED